MLSVKLKRSEKGRGENFLIIVAIIYSLIFARLFFMQIVKVEKYKKMSNKNSIKVKRVNGYRGKIYDSNGELLVNNEAGYRLVYLNERKYDEKKLDEMSKLLGYDKKTIEKRIKYGEIYNYTRENVIFDDISKEKAHKIIEKNSDFSYLEVQIYSKRKYLNESLGSHILGYVRNVSSDEYEKMKDSGYKKDDIIGKQGIEKQYESYLRGENGYRYIEVNAHNRFVKTLEEKKPKMGDDIYLTVDFDLQQKITDYMNMKKMKGAFVAIEPKTGRIITMASNPEYPLNTIISKMTTKEWDDIMFNKDRPLENRAITGRYPPGSIFKALSALAFLEEGLNPKETFFDPGYYQIGKWKWRSWKREGHGYTDLTKSLVESVNYYYYRAADKYGRQKMLEVADAFGIGKKTGVDIPGEKPGLLPDNDWKKKRLKEPWYTGDSINLSIGQGYLLVTPLQMAKAYSILANKGYTYTPHLVEKIVTEEGKIKEIKGEREEVKYNKRYMEEIKEALVQTVEAKDGTAKRLRTNGVRVAAKTGSAQNSKYKEPHSWVSGYFPADKPEIAFTAFIEGGGSGGKDAAEVAKVFIDAYLEKGKVAEENSERK
ncbi:penicillin-binding protein 2 [Psychrilyobacter piezotolerans]|uniref:Penicillin-binding protein 2 n=2 Tax=Fusobacteriaceae TaxID=203492 RepID=A0ABX9KLH4_9FUSO|nr:penicillin-binding protein 2 [Psychrilyobacter piezotolerans]RDE66166.1 penicillin-binding protein 2 [Psychrilyobacter sp. S5]REI43344.1 penicillin-binding protein 2 [Psychrilyobacter piezotolerans]